LVSPRRSERNGCTTRSTQLGHSYSEMPPRSAVVDSIPVTSSRIGGTSPSGPRHLLCTISFSMGPIGKTSVFTGLFPYFFSAPRFAYVVWSCVGYHGSKKALVASNKSPTAPTNKCAKISALGMEASARVHERHEMAALRTQALNLFPSHPKSM
jgi:hypothetical protein